MLAISECIRSHRSSVLGTRRGKAVPWEPQETGRRSRPHGQVIALVTEAVRSAPEGMTEYEVLRYVRSHVPDASTHTVRYYLGFFYAERFDWGEDGRYMLSHRNADRCADGVTSGSAIKLVTK